MRKVLRIISQYVDRLRDSQIRLHVLFDGYHRCIPADAIMPRQLERRCNSFILPDSRKVQSHMFESAYLKEQCAKGLPYAQYLTTGTADQQEAWTKIHEQVALTADQQELLAGFTRDMHVLVSSGIWCGDCVQQGPLIQRIAEGNPDRIKLVWVDRDEHADLAAQLQVNAGLRVPMAIFAAEDFECVSIYGDRSLTRYRAIAERALGPSCPLPGAPVPTEELAATLQDWLDEFERVQLLLRVSGRLRERHGD